MTERERKKSPLDAWHREHGARMVAFSGWDMPVQYETGILAEHLATRRYGGLFDVSHMGRFIVRGDNAVAFLQHVLSNDAAGLSPWEAQYTLIPNERGGVIDDSYLYRLDNDEYLLVVNAGNREKDWVHLTQHADAMEGVELEDHTARMGMIAFQGPAAEARLEALLERGRLPESRHNAVSRVTMLGTDLVVARTGYTGEPICFELFVPVDMLVPVWSALYTDGTNHGILPVGLGARDTLRLEAGMPLYGHEFGEDPAGEEIPAFAVPLVRVAVSFADDKGAFIGRDALAAQRDEVARLRRGDAPSGGLPRRIRKLAVLDRGVARHGDEVLLNGETVGVVTSGTTTPYWVLDASGEPPEITDATGRRALALAYVDARLEPGQEVQVQVRKRRLAGRLVKRHGTSRKPPYFRPEVAGV